MKKKSFIKDGLSINETRISVLIILTIITVSFALFMYAKNGDFVEIYCLFVDGLWVE